MPGSVILGGARTPIGKLSGAVSTLSAVQLGSIAIAEALSRAGLAGEEVDYVVMGQVLQAGAGQGTARQAAAGAGVPLGTPAATINKVCLSGLNAIHLADLMVRAGEARVVVAGGMESMSSAPHLLPGARGGLRLGGAQIVDAISSDGLTCAFESRSMGEATDDYAAKAGISRDRQDAVAAASHERASAATKAGVLAEEIVPVHAPRRRGESELVENDEGILPGTTIETLARLRSAFSPTGTITAGNASQISDGAAAVVVCSTETAEQLGRTPLAEIVSYGQVAGPDPSLLTQPSRAVRAALERAAIPLSAVDLFELNEAFAAVVCASLDDLGISQASCNPNGGAIALGHPIGMSGARLALTLAYELRRRGGGTGVVALCGGGGQGDAMVVRTLA